MSNLINNLSDYWNKIHYNLFPSLEETFDTKLSKKNESTYCYPRDGLHRKLYPK